MSGEFDRKAHVVAGCYVWVRNDEKGKQFLIDNDLALIAAAIHDWDMGTVNDELKGIITDTYDFILTGLNVEDKGYESYGHVILEWEKQNGK